MLLMLLDRQGEKGRCRPNRRNRSRVCRIPSMKRGKAWAALRRPKGMKENSNRPNGVVMAMLCESLGWAGIRLYAVTRLISAVPQKCVELDAGDSKSVRRQSP
jgi:hypothetical protein